MPVQTGDCTGIFKSRSHVDVGLHLQLASHPRTKVMENFLGKPRTRTVFVPVIHLTKSLTVKSPVGLCWKKAARTLSTAPRSEVKGRAQEITVFPNTWK